jgi:uncharacterized protein YndB with AHSA1/START domain
MVDIIHRVGIKAPVQKVYQALSTTEGISGWWTEQVSGVSQIGEIIAVRFLSTGGDEIGSMQMEVKALDPGKKVHWTFLVGPEEWIGTDVIFELHEEGDYTIVLFAHRNWREQVEFTAHCSMKWGIFMLSLKEFVETGKGKPSPNDIKIDNWN